MRSGAGANGPCGGRWAVCEGRAVRHGVPSHVACGAPICCEGRTLGPFDILLRSVARGKVEHQVHAMEEGQQT